MYQDYYSLHRSFIIISSVPCDPPSVATCCPGLYRNSCSSSHGFLVFFSHVPNSTWHNKVLDPKPESLDCYSNTNKKYETMSHAVKTITCLRQNWSKAFLCQVADDGLQWKIGVRCRFLLYLSPCFRLLLKYFNLRP